MRKVIQVPSYMFDEPGLCPRSHCVYGYIFEEAEERSGILRAGPKPELSKMDA